MTVGFYAPLPPARSGVADYAADLLNALRRFGPVEPHAERCDAALYHLGNNGLHAEIYRRALERPGVVVLHDAVLHHFLLGRLSHSEYLDEFAYNYGEWNRGLAEDLWRNRAVSASDARYFQFPLLKRVAERSRAAIVHNPAAARMVAQHAPGIAVVEIPLLFAAPPAPAESEVERYRQKLGWPPGAFVFGVFGYLRESKRLASVLEAFAALHTEVPQTALVVAGVFTSAELERAVQPLLAAPGVYRVPFLPEDEFRLAAAAIDACINLRDPAAGETSAITVRLMGIGKPVLLTDGEENAQFPEDTCLRVSPGLAERDSLLHHMVLLTSIPGVRGAVGSRAAAFVQEHHSLPRVARLYWDTLCAYCS